MCCGSTETLELPPSVIEALAGYRRLLDERGWDWGDEQIDVFQAFRFSEFGPVLEHFLRTGDWQDAVRSALGDAVPAGVVIVRVDQGGGLKVATGPVRAAVVGRPVVVDVIVDSAADAPLTISVAGEAVSVGARGAAVRSITVDGGEPVFTVALDGEVTVIDPVARTTPAAELRLSSPRCSRWSVTDASGGAWFPEGVLPKWDFHDRPFFHGHEFTVTVPAGDVRVVCTRGMEFERLEREVSAAAGASLEVACDPARLFDPAAAGWYGGDLHVHMNYSGDLVCTPAEAARMQLGEGLHLMNLVAANCLTSLVYDREMLEEYCGTHLPWSTTEAVAQPGVEYRNDLLGHVHALGPNALPRRYYTGHDRSDHPEDWPPNKVGCEELQGLGATVGYCHPVFQPFPKDGDTRRFFHNPRSVEARELVADAALGVVDSIDLISPSNDEGAVFLYHRLLSCGLRLAATAGTDTFLSFSHSSTFSNPPGWGRVYAHLGAGNLSVEAFKEAIRQGRTVVTNGPWLTFTVDGQEPGAVLDVAPGTRLEVRASVVAGAGAHLAVLGPDGVVAETDADNELVFAITVDEPLWLAAVARGGDADVLDESVLAHTSPVYIDVAGQRVARAADAQWCLDFLDSLETLAAEHGHFAPATRDAHLGELVAVLDQARAFYRQVAESAAR